MRDRSPYPEPVWTDRTINRKHGATTFVQCGWCEHCTPSSGRCYNAVLAGPCALIPYGDLRDRRWDNPCVVMQLGKTDQTAIVGLLESDVESLRQRVARLQQGVRAMKHVRVAAKPPLPQFRPDGYAAIGSRVYVFHDGAWRKGAVVNGYRSGDGCISYELDGFPESAGGWGCGMAAPCVLEAWEYDYFCAHPDDWSCWLDLSDHLYNGKRLPIKAYRQALLSQAGGSAA